MGRRVLGAAALLLLGACTPSPQAAASACMAPLKPAVQVDLYFGRQTGTGREITEAEWASFLNEEVTPRFPAGLSVVDVVGQYREPSGVIQRERSKLLVIVVFDGPAHGPGIEKIVSTYSKRYAQNAVLRVERAVCAGA